MVVNDEESHVYEGGGEALAIPVSHVAILQMEPAGPKDLRGEVELLPPVRDDPVSEKLLSPIVHLPCHRFGDPQERGAAVDGLLETPLVVQRHGRNLAQGILPVEHPAVGAGKQSVGGISEVLLERGTRPGGGTGALNPLPSEIARNLASLELSCAGVTDRDSGSWNQGVRREKVDPLHGSCPLRPAADTSLHQGSALGIKPRQ